MLAGYGVHQTSVAHVTLLACSCVPVNVHAELCAHLRGAASIQTERWRNRQHKAPPERIWLPTADNPGCHLRHQPAQQLSTQTCNTAVVSVAT